MGHTISYVDGLLHAVGLSLMSNGGDAYGVGMLSAKGIAKPTKEATLATFNLIHRFVAQHVSGGFRVYHHRVAPILQRLYPTAVVGIAVVGAQQFYHL